jgi:hypothetical protein
LQVEILDCTLRDGGYINDWGFSEEQITNIMSSLDTSMIDIIECGYLNDQREQSNDTTLFHDTQSIDKHLIKLSGKALSVVMINFGDYDISQLSPKADTKLDGIRLAFHKKNLHDVIESAKLIMEKGYKLFFQPMLTDLYSDDELEELLRICNELQPYAAYIVDSFGSMQKEQLQHLLNLYESRLSKDIIIGFHAHNNLQLAFANNIELIESGKRSLIVDSSIYGMGRGAGNLNTELIANYLNQKADKYKITPLLEVIDSHLDAIYRETYWGYSAAYYLSAKMKIHPNYAKYLINKKTLTVSSIEKILNMIDDEHKNGFDTEYISTLLQKYNTNLVCSDITNNINFTNDEVLLIASGQSVEEFQNEINQYIQINKPTVISVNHIDEYIKCDYLFFSNEKRYIEFSSQINTHMNILLTSNVVSTLENAKHIDFDTLYKYQNICSTNVSVLLLSFLALNNIHKVTIAGLDGFNTAHKNNYSYNEEGRVLDQKYLLQENRALKSALEVLDKEIEITFITPSIFKED